MNFKNTGKSAKKKMTSLEPNICRKWCHQFLKTIGTMLTIFGYIYVDMYMFYIPTKYEEY